MTTYRWLKKEFDRKVLDLQKKCPHKHLSKWMEVCWAPGHYTGDRIRVCNDCNKQVSKEKSVME